MTTIAIAAQPTATQESASAAKLWTGRIASGIGILFLAFDGIVKLVNPAEVQEASEKLGCPAHVAPYLGVVLLACVALYAIRRTAPLGAVLLTGYLGGAVFVHVRVGDPMFSHTLFPIYFGILLWLGLFLRDSRVRNLIATEGK